MTASAPDLSVFHDAERRQIEAEIENDPAFGRVVANVLHMPGGPQLIALSAKKAVANAFNPSYYPESAGSWPVLRRTALKLATDLPDIVEAEVDKLPFEAKMAIVRQIAQGAEMEVAGVSGLSGLGQFEFIGTIISNIAAAGSKIYGAKVTAGAQKDIAKIQAQTDMKNLQAQVSIANAEAAITQANQSPIVKAASALAKVPATVAGVLTADIGAGVPFWVVPVVLGVLGIVIFFVLRR